MKIGRLVFAMVGLLTWSGLAFAQGQGQSPPSPTPSQAPAGSASDSAAVSEARSRFQRGVTLFREGDFRAALIEFNRAYEAAPNYRILYNVGQTCLELQDYPCALKSLEQYLAEGADEVPSPRRTEVEADIARVISRIGHLRVEVNRPGAEIFVDDVLVGRSPLEGELKVGAGRRRITVAKPPSPQVHRILDIAGGDHATVSVDLVDPSPPPAPPPARSSTAPIWIGVATSGALAAATAVFAVLTLDAQSSFDDERDKYPASRTAIDDARSRVETLALATDILGATTVVAIGVTTVLALTRKSGTSSAGGAGPSIAVGPGVFGGRF